MNIPSLKNLAVTSPVRSRTDCRLCGSENLTQLWDFGKTPLANAYIAPDKVGQPEVFAPLVINFCQDCKLVQLRDVVDPRLLFGTYLYVSSTSPSFVKHFEDYAAHVTQRFNLNKNDLVVDVGSNDGILLKPFKAKGVRILGIDPAENIAAQATREGIPTEATFFTPQVAGRLRKKHGAAKVLTANNVFAHTDDVHTFVNAAKELLANDGVFIFEVQYLKSLLEQNLFDIIYHEHLLYYHVAPLLPFFEKHGLQVFDVERFPVHGGSIRVYVSRQGSAHTPTPQLQQVLDAEDAAGLNTLTPYESFRARIDSNKQELLQMLRDLKAQGKRIVGYGAPAKATTLLYAFGIDGSLLDYIIDDSPLKQGRLMPGLHIPIVPSDKLYEDTPDYCVILAWNFADPIMKTHAKYVEKGGHFIIPVPSPRLI